MLDWQKKTKTKKKFAKTNCLSCAQTILGEFSKEQDAFIKGQQGSADAAVPPWIGHQNEEKVKEEILGLSSVCIGIVSAFRWMLNDSIVCVCVGSS